jgi:hypothetical protein
MQPSLSAGKTTTQLSDTNSSIALTRTVVKATRRWNNDHQPTKRLWQIFSHRYYPEKPKEKGVSPQQKRAF